MKEAYVKHVVPDHVKPGDILEKDTVKVVRTTQNTADVEVSWKLAMPHVEAERQAAAQARHPSQFPPLPEPPNPGA